MIVLIVTCVADTHQELEPSLKTLPQANIEHPLADANQELPAADPEQTTLEEKDPGFGFGDD